MTSPTQTVLHLAGPLVLVAVFTLPALEASTLLGIVAPGELALVLGGVLAQQGRVPLWAVVVAGAAGAVVGDTVGYVIGRKVGERLLAHLPRRLVTPRQVEQATALLRQVGGRVRPARLRRRPGLAQRRARRRRGRPGPAGGDRRRCRGGDAAAPATPWSPRPARTRAAGRPLRAVRWPGRGRWRP
jgi:hypothetical protein